MDCAYTAERSIATVRKFTLLVERSVDRRSVTGSIPVLSAKTLLLWIRAPC
ncbi:MAG TPA: hypothetical protein V6D28_28165 [Leptolyngbyaceae cyanobacterium]